MADMTPAPAAGGGGGLVARLGGPRNAAILGAGGTVALVALLAMRRNKGASGSTTTITGDTAFDSGPYDMWQQWQQEYEDLQSQISAQGGGQTSAGGGPSTRPIPTPLPIPVPKPPVPTPAPGGRPPKPLPKPPWQHHPGRKPVVVKRGDTLSGIAKRSGISMATLKKLNPVYWTNPKYHHGNRIFAGDKVKV